MIVASTDEGYRFVTQPDHAALAGRFADRWGNERFSAPTPPTAVSTAAHRHDDGWRDYDRRPHLDDDGEIVGFRSVPAGVWTDRYREGIDGVVELDPYAGLLVSMHGSGLRRRRYGLSPSWPSTPPAFETFVEREEARQDRLATRLVADGRLDRRDRSTLADLHETGSPPEGTDSRLWSNYALLQAWDALSLAFCETASPPESTTIDRVPTGPGQTATLTVEALGGGDASVEPYPFDGAPLRCSVPARTVRADAFEDEASLQRAYGEAPREYVEFALRPP